MFSKWKEAINDCADTKPGTVEALLFLSYFSVEQLTVILAHFPETPLSIELAKKYAQSNTKELNQQKLQLSRKRNEENRMKERVSFKWTTIRKKCEIKHKPKKKDWTKKTSLEYCKKYGLSINGKAKELEERIKNHYSTLSLSHEPNKQLENIKN